jgi:hypothetical protein
MRTQVWFHGHPEDLDRMEAELHAWKLDAFVASAWGPQRRSQARRRAAAESQATGKTRGRPWHHFTLPNLTPTREQAWMAPRRRRAGTRSPRTTPHSESR